MADTGDYEAQGGDYQDADENVDVGVQDEAPPKPPPTAPPAATGYGGDAADPEGGYGAGMSDPNAGGYQDPTGIPEKSQAEEYDDKADMCLGGLVVASCVALAQSARECDKLIAPIQKCDGAYAYAVSVGCISLVGALTFLVGRRYKPEMFKGFTAYYSLFSVLWWGVGTAIATFDKPFNATGNGYFAFWGATMLSIYFAQISVSKFSALVGVAMKAVAGSMARRLLMLIMIFSFVEAFACLTYDSLQGTLKPTQVLWGFLCGMISGGIIAIFILLKSFNVIGGSPTLVQWMARFLCVWWLFGAGVVTFDEPFTTTGNGYFMAWGAFLASCYLVVLCEKGEATLTQTVEDP